MCSIAVRISFIIIIPTHLATVEQLSGAETVGERVKDQALLKERERDLIPAPFHTDTEYNE